MTATSIDAAGLAYRRLNELVREAVTSGSERVELSNVRGQRFIGTSVRGKVEIVVDGTPGNDLGAFMDGPRIEVLGNAQDGCGNTMNDGEIVVHGRAGDVLALSARGGKVFVRDGVGYRAGIHMKEYEGRGPLVVVGGTAQDFLGEYMAGGTLVVLGRDLEPGERHAARFIGTGLHGGAIFLRGEFAPEQLSEDVEAVEPDEGDLATLRNAVGEFADRFGLDAESLMRGRFWKLRARALRPYGNLYAD